MDTVSEQKVRLKRKVKYLRTEWQMKQEYCVKWKNAAIRDVQMT